MSRKVYLVAVDGSEWSDRAAERAVTLAKDTGAEVHFITVLPWPTFQSPYVKNFEIDPLDKEQQEKNIRSELLDPLNQRFDHSGVKIKTELFWGTPNEVIHERAKHEHVNMIFLGRRGRSKVFDLVLGSVANTLAHTAGVPIVLVP